jgi:FdhD protein
MSNSLRKQNIHRVQPHQVVVLEDVLAVEEPLEIRLSFGPSAQRQTKSLAVTMRTPGADFDLVTGFLYTEGIIAAREDVLQIRFVGEQLSLEAQENVVQVDLKASVPVDFEKLNRHFYTASSCGICGKASLEMVQMACPFVLLSEFPKLAPAILLTIPDQLRQQQSLFALTGGIHAAGLFSAQGELLFLREDVGRHNALDKVIGAALQKMPLPLKDTLLMVSGRASFELVQKALMAGIPILAAVGAPSSLAAELAEAYNMTLIGFLRGQQFNVYSGLERLAMPE